MVRLKFSEGQGPARECQGGSGYWSQDRPILVMATPTPPLAAEVLWPSGAKTTTPIPPNASEIRIAAPDIPNNLFHRFLIRRSILCGVPLALCRFSPQKHKHTKWFDWSNFNLDI